jgi:hypothetical protein
MIRLTLRKFTRQAYTLTFDLVDDGLFSIRWRSRRRFLTTGLQGLSSGEVAMTVKELIVRLQALPNQDALVIIASSNANEWLVATGIVERGISPSPANPDFVVPGNDPGVEII